MLPEALYEMYMDSRKYSGQRQPPKLSRKVGPPFTLLMERCL